VLEGVWKDVGMFPQTGGENSLLVSVN